MKMKTDRLVGIWADNPDAFELEAPHVREKYRAAVEAARGGDSLGSDTIDRHRKEFEFWNDEIPEVGDPEAEVESDE